MEVLFVSDMFSGALMVMLVGLIMCRRVIWHGICLLIGQTLFNGPVRDKPITNKVL